jgi:hypothetical protein
MILAGLILVLAPWGWGGVVLWTVAAALGFAAAAFIAAFAEARTQRIAMAAWFLGLLLALYGASAEGAAPWTYRWLDYVCFPACALVGSSIATFLLSRDLTSRPAAELRDELFRSVPFWAGVALFTYFAIQDFNAWGVVVDREAFWAKQGLPGIDVGKFDIRPQPYLSWLPSGLNAPFSAADTSQPPMNAWRQMMILGAPWLLFCSLQIGLRRRRAYVLLGWVTVLTACAVGAFGFLHQQSNGSILGYPVPYNTTCFGTFMNRNHAGAYLYLHASLALALTFWHIRRAGENTLKGGPHLVAAFLAFALALLVTLTSSTGGVGVVIVLFVVSLPLAYYFGFPGSRGSRKQIIIVTGAAMLLSAAAILAMVDLKPIIDRFQKKAATSAISTHLRTTFAAPAVKSPNASTKLLEWDLPTWTVCRFMTTSHPSSFFHLRASAMRPPDRPGNSFAMETLRRKATCPSIPPAVIRENRICKAGHTTSKRFARFAGSAAVVR